MAAGYEEVGSQSVGLDAIIRQASRAALLQMADLAENIRYQEVDSSNYDPTTGGASRTLLQSHDIKGWFTSYTERETDGTNVQPGDKRLTIAATEVSFPTRIHDYVVDSREVQWEVISIKKPITDAVFILQVRTP